MHRIPRLPPAPFLAVLVLGVVLLAGGLPRARGGDDATATAADRLAALPEGDAAAAYRLALELEAEGKDEMAHRALERVIAIDPDHRAARRALGFEHVDGAWLAGDDLYRAKGFIHHDGRWMTAQEFADATRPAREAAEQREGERRVLGLLAMIASEEEDLVQTGKRRLALVEDRFKLAPLAQALRCEPPSLRIYAAESLGRLDDPLAVPALLKRAIEDPEEDVRHAVVDALRAIDEPSTVHPLGRALSSRYAPVRVRAAEALGRLGDEVGAGYVIKRYEMRSGDFPRAYFAQMKQISYIQDFDVEVAQTSFIADPVVGVLQEGVVQDVKIVATEHTYTTVERIAYQEALEDITGQRFGDDVRAWSRWWRANETRLLEQRHARHEARAARRAAGDGED